MQKYLLVALLLTTVAHANDSYPLVVHERVTKKFLDCGESKEMSKLVDTLMASGKVKEKTSSHFSFPIRGSVLGLPFKEMWVGVCDTTGERACGWGAFRAFIIDMSFADAKAKLKSRYKLDFTVQKRDADSEVTERPVLTKLKESGDTALFCDPGGL